MALVRVKRRAQDDPIDVLLLACKKFKAAEESPVATVFKFAATVNEQTLIFLWFAGHQTASYRDVADRFDVTISSLFRVNVRLIHFISNLSEEVIRWPSRQERRDIEAHFRAKGFPEAIGAVDGTHIRIDKPSVDPDSYCNRKKYFSVQEGDVKTHLSQAAGVPKVPLKYRQNEVTTITEKLRAENKLFSQNNRLKVVNCFRALDSQLADGGLEDVDDGKSLTVVDIESAPSTREAPKGSSNSEVLPSTEEQYVYDLYYSRVGDFDDLLLENVLSAHEVDEKLFFGDLAGNGSDNDSNVYEDEDDSNDENNWRNEYPDEEEADDESSLDEEDMKLAMGMANVNINGERESDLSSDREDEALIYGDDDRKGYYFQTTSDSDSDFYN